MGYQVKEHLHRVRAQADRRSSSGRFLRGELRSRRGIIIEDVLLRDVQAARRASRESIEAKLTAEQKVQQKQFELEQAKKDAEIEIARAEGAARRAAHHPGARLLSDSYLQYLWIQTLNENPNVIYVATEANLPIFKPTK